MVNSRIFYTIVFLFTAFTAAPSYAQKLPSRPTGPVADYAQIIDQTTERSIYQLAKTLWVQAKFALIVTTLEDIGDEPIENVAVNLYEKWGIGRKETEEGVLVLLTLNPRKVRIEVGYGAEGYLNDAKTGRLIDEFGIPYFRQNNYSDGILQVCSAIAREVAKEKGIALNGKIQTPMPVVRETREVSPIKLILGVIVFIILMSTRFGRALLIAMLLSGGRGGSSGGGFGGGLGGRGFGGGFGGGSSGGGGASRSF